MNLDEFLWHAKRGHGECILEMKKGNISNFKDIIKKVFLNNYAFLINDEYRSAYVCELVGFYNDDKYFLDILWKKIIRTKLINYYTFDYLINNLYFILLRNVDCNYENKIKHFLLKNLNKECFTSNENYSICSLMSLIVDLNMNISIKEIVDRHYDLFNNSNLDLSYFEYCYHVSLKNKKNNSNLKNEEILKSFNALVECVSDDNYFNKQLPYIANNISDKFCELLLDLLDDGNVHSSIKTNILKIILYSKKKTNITLDKIIGIIDKSTKDQKTIIYDILSTMKSKKLLSKLYKIKLEDSLLIRLILNNYSEDKYEEVHNKIAKLKIDYANSNNWFEIESDLIKCTNKKKYR
ncbi:MAG: hypothetical protein SOZ04_02850 [Bacilli bacterium]|nr:hypothetical protein [Bacilli bacterium]